MKLSGALLFLLVSAQVSAAQPATGASSAAPPPTPIPPPASEISLVGAIDFHCHSAPDSVARSLDSFEVVRQARAAGMRGVVLKNHFVSTAAIAQLAMRELPGIEVFGGIVLNRAAGGINAEAVRRMAQVDGKRGKVVWLPTFDAENQVRFSREDRPFVSVVKDGRPVPELAEVLRIAAEADLVFATGHSSPAESLIVLEAAHRVGVKRLLVTHVLTEPTRATLEQMRAMAALGAVMECTFLAHVGGPSWQTPGAGATKAVPMEDCVKAIQAIGAEHFLITSDLGQPNNPAHTVGLRAFVVALRQGGLSEREIELITRSNPARLLGLTP